MNNKRTTLCDRQNDPCGEFSSVSAHPFKLNGRVWPTSEHYLLLSTGGAELIEHTRNDRHWVDGGDGMSKNGLGILLIGLRSELILNTEPTANPTIR